MISRPITTKATTTTAAALIYNVNINNSYGRDPSTMSYVALCADKPLNWNCKWKWNENENFHAHSPRQFI